MLSKRLESLRVYETPLTLMRVGRPHDGGYVCAKLPITPDLILSGGIADDNSFEDHLCSLYPTVTCRAFDPEGNGGAYRPANYKFEHRKLPPMSEFPMHSNIFAKVDIEGGEWEWLKAMSHSHLCSLAQLVIEVHDMGNRSDDDWAQLARLTQYVTLIHCHPNNWDTFVEIDGVKIPKTIELTYVKSSTSQSMKKSFSKKPIPSALDMSNLANRPDLKIDWEPFVHA
jgi:hypothetical protein